jgi:hypothetical protein
LIPVVVRHISSRFFPELERRGNASWLSSLWVALKASGLFVIILVLGLPFHLIPGVGILLSTCATAYLFVRLMSFECLSEHASTLEYQEIYGATRPSAWAIGLTCAILSLLPPLLLFIPVYSALAFSYFYLQKLREHRSQSRLSPTLATPFEIAP